MMLSELFFAERVGCNARQGPLMTLIFALFAWREHAMWPRKVCSFCLWIYQGFPRWSLGPWSSLLAMLPWTFICSWFFRKHLFSFHQYKCHSFRRCTYLSNIIFLTGRKESRFNANAYRWPMKNVIDLLTSIYFGSCFYFHYLWAQCQCVHIYNCCIFLRTYYICCI